MHRKGAEISQHRGKWFTIYIFGTFREAALPYYLTLDIEHLITRCSDDRRISSSHDLDVIGTFFPVDVNAF